MRDELLNETIFYDLDHAHSLIARWIAGFYQRRPHSALGYCTPAAYAATLNAMGNRLRTGAAAPISTSDSGFMRMNQRGYSSRMRSKTLDTVTVHFRSGVNSRRE